MYQLVIEFLRIFFLFIIIKQRHLVVLELIVLFVNYYHQEYELKNKLAKLSDAPLQVEPKLPQSESNNSQDPQKPLSGVISDEFEFKNRFSIRMHYVRSIVFLLLCALRRYFGNVSDLALFLSTSIIPEFLCCLHANAKMTLLIEKLCKTQVDTYEQAPDTDEFDEDAPPPSVSISIGPLMTFARAVRLLGGGLPNWLSWQRPLASRLAKCSVIAFMDRAGPIAEPFPLPSELLGVQNNEIARYPLSVTVSSSDRQLNLTFEDPSAKPDLSLLCFFSTLFDFERSHPLTCHLAVDWMKLPSPYEQSCLCIFEKLFRSSVNHVKLLKSQAMHNGLRFLEVCVSTLDGVFQVLLVCGDFAKVLKRCSHYFDSGKENIVEIDSNLKSDFETYFQYLQQQDSKLFSFAFIPVLEGEELEDFLQYAKFIWISGFALAYTPKEEMAELVQDLAGAGIRFVYFSPSPERETKAFADRLEMETDWNSCIILSNPKDDKCDYFGYSAISDIKARLPHGIGSIRQHLLDVDDIPLHVSFFAECDHQASKEMLRIYRENGEAVITVFSLFNSNDSHRMFSTSSLCIGMESSSKDFSTSMISWPCSFLLPYEASPYVLTDILKEARRLTKHSEHFIFYFVVYCAALSGGGSVSEFAVIAVVCLLLQKSSDALLKEMPENLNQPVVSWKSTRDWACMFSGLFLSSLLLPCIFPLLLLHYSVVNSKALLVLALALPLYISSSVFSATYRDIVCTCFAISITLLMGRYFYKKLERRFEKQQKRAKLIFNTKLGMHSPV